MGMHLMYDDRRPLPPPVPKNWLVIWADPDTGNRDCYEFTTEADAVASMAKLMADHGIAATVRYSRTKAAH